LTYAGEGIPVFPCKPGGKEPLTPRGFKDASTNPQQITAWWNRWPNANIGIPTGKRSGWLVVDVDNPASLDALEAKHGKLPATRTHGTGSGGFHYLLTYPAGEHFGNSSGDLPKGIDIRGEGGYIIAPPSVTTGPYKALNRLPLAAPPEWLLQALRRPHSASDGNSEGATPTGSPDRCAPIAEGQRNETLFKYGCALRARGFDHVAILEELQNTNERLCSPPLDSGEVERIAESASKYEPGKASPGAGQEVLERLAEIEAVHLWGRKWTGQGWKTPRSVIVELIREARKHGQKTKAGIRVSISVRNLALAATVGLSALSRPNGALDKLKDAGLIRSVKGSGTKSGAYVLLEPSVSRSIHSTTEQAPPLSVFTQTRYVHMAPTSPRLRYNKPVYETVDRVSTRVDTVLRLGKSAENVVDILERVGTWITVPALGAELGIKHHRNLNRRTLPRLQAAGVVECSTDAVRLRSDWLTALNRKREEDQELDDYERDKKKYAEESRIYALKVEACKLSHLGMSPEEIAGELKIGTEVIYRLLEKARPVADFVPVADFPDGYIEEPQRVEEEVSEEEAIEDFDGIEIKPLLTPLAVACRDYLERNPSRATETPSWIANTLWAYDLHPGKPTRHEVTVALEQGELLAVA
jgi:hypothetical protein